jgi:hypothetical protein
MVAIGTEERIYKKFLNEPKKNKKFKVNNH